VRTCWRRTCSVACRQQFVAKDPRVENHIVNPGRDHGRYSGDQSRLILIIWMDHDHDVSTGAQGFRIARLLVASVTEILLVHEHGGAQLPRDRDRIVIARVVDEDDFVDEVSGDGIVRPLKRPPRPVGGKDHDYLLIMQHTSLLA
jgi:hypothetical protein